MNIALLLLKNQLEMKYAFLVTLFFMLSSCKKEKKELVEVKQVSSEFILEFLNEILADTSESSYFDSKVQLVSNYSIMLPDRFLNGTIEDPSKEFYSLVDYISFHLKTEDTSYVFNQFQQNKELNLNKLSKYGYKMFDNKKCFDNNLKNDSILKLIIIENKKYNFVPKYDLLTVSKPLFNKQQNLVYIRFQRGFSGETVIFEKKNNKWKFKEILSSWVE